MNTVIVRVSENKNKLKEPANLQRKDFYECLKMGCDLKVQVYTEMLGVNLPIIFSKTIQ